MAGENTNRRKRRREEAAQLVQGLPGNGFTHGAVTRISAKNFLTFTEFEMCPEPNLNLIIGPNGTGKSSLVNAIILGLAGKPSQLGRAGNIVDFIQYGKDKAHIEIELFNKDGINWRVGREIVRKSGVNANTNWTINGESVTFQVVENLMKTLKIQVGNLCQFLPQDKVADFSKMTPVDLLLNTELAAGGDTMYQDHKNLVELRRKTRELESSIKTSNDNLEEQQGQNSKVEERLQQYQERQVILENIALLKKKKAWLEYEEVRCEFHIQKEKSTRLTKELDQLRKSFAPQERAVETAKTKLNMAKDHLSRSANSKDLHTSLTLFQRKFDEQSSKVLDIKSYYQTKKQEEENRKKNIDTANQKIKLFEAQLIEFRRENPVSQETMDTLRRDIQDLSQEMSITEGSRINLQSAKVADQRELRNLEQERSRLEDVSRQRENILRQRDRHAHEALLWMRANKDKFRSNVYEPIMININMRDMRFAKYLEAHIPFKDMVAFSFENFQDREMFMREIRDKQNLNVNAVDVPREPLDSFQATDIKQFSKFGFNMYLRDVFDAPDGVMRYLCKQYRVHMVPIGNQETEKMIEKVTSSLTFSRFYTINTQYNCRTSRYNKNIKSTQASNINPSRLLSTSVDLNRIGELEQLCTEFRDRLTKTEERMTILDQEDHEKKKRLEEMRKALNQGNNARSHLKNLEGRIKQQTELRNHLQGSSTDLKMEEETARSKIKAATMCKADILKERKNVVKKSAVVHFKRILAALNQSVAEKDLMTAQKNLDEARNIFKAQQTELVEFKKEMNDTKNRAIRILHLAKQSCGLSRDEALPEELKEQFGKLSDDLEEIQNAITEEEARADCLNDVDPDVIQEYEKRRKNIGHLVGDLKNRQGALDELLVQAREIKERWYPALKDLIDRVNKNFSCFFAQLNCVGEILLNETNNAEDFDKWGINIRVKFRDTECLKDLTPFHHSGGEQSVSTGLYMLSLQELTQVPFRCVDEINQGMDPKNERKVFDLITETACRNNNAQYFLLTPKLLPNLTYSVNMKIFVIYNGPYFLATKNWGIPRFLKVETQMQAEAEEEQ